MMQGEFQIIRSKQKFNDWCEQVKQSHDWSLPLAVQSKVQKGTRTLSQNNAMHLDYQRIANTLNDGGIDQRVLYGYLKEGVEIQWTAEAVKGLFKTLMTAMFPDIKSTTQLSKGQVSKLRDTFELWCSEHMPQIQLPPFPSEENFEAR